MKKAFRTPSLYFIGTGMVVLGLALPFGIYGITCIPSLNLNPFPYPYLLWAFIAVYFLLGFVIADIIVVRHRRKTKNYDGVVEQEVKDKAWSIRFPFFFASAVLLTVGLFFEAWALIAGTYPLPFSF